MYVFSGVHEIHPSFRIVAIGDWDNESKWLNEQVLALFPFHTIKPLSTQAQCHVINSLVPNCNPKDTEQIVDFVSKLKSSSDAGVSFLL